MQITGIDESGLDQITVGVDNLRLMLDEGFDHVGSILTQLNAIRDGIAEFWHDFCTAVDSFQG